MIKKVIVDKEAAGQSMCSRVLQRLSGSAIEWNSPLEEQEREQEEKIDKETLRLISFHGEFLKPCPGTERYICCGYQILNIGTNCPFDCSYCILQTYLNQPSLRVFVNLETKLQQIGNQITGNPHKIFRIGTGEFTDSLALDPHVGWTDLLLPFFSVLKNTVLELKTKTDHINGLISSPHRNRIVISWSLNSPYIAAREEKGAPAIEKRLKAARRCQAEGFALGFHFDPLVYHPGWKEQYLRTIELLDKYIVPEGIIWISLGCLRYMPGLKAIIRRRHPESHVLDGELVPGLDGKMRYFKPLRIEMYAYMIEKLRAWHRERDPGIYLCMESSEVWQKSFGWNPGTSGGLSNYLDERVTKIMDHAPDTI